MATIFLSITKYKKNTFTNMTGAKKPNKPHNFHIKNCLSCHNLPMLDCKDSEKEMDKNVISVKNWH